MRDRADEGSPRHLDGGGSGALFTLAPVVPAEGLTPALVALIATTGGAILAAGLRRRGGRRGETRQRREERELRALIARGRYDRAVPALLEHGRVAEAAHLEALRGHTDEAARLYERAGDVRGAASVFLTRGEPEMAALTFKEAGFRTQAAALYVQMGRYDAAATLYEEAGELERAAEAWQAHGDTERVAAVLERLGGSSDTARLVAERAERAGRYGEAAEAWERVGEMERAAEAWQHAERPARAGRLLADLGELRKAAPLLERGGDLQRAGELYARLGQYRDAAQACYRAGEAGLAEQLLVEGHEWLALARFQVQQQREDEAIETLQRLGPRHERYEEGRELLAELLERRGDAEGALAVYEDLVQRRMRAERYDDVLRSWTVRVGQLLIGMGRREDAIARLRGLEGLGLMTDELRQRLERLEQPARAPSSEASSATQASASEAPASEEAVPDLERPVDDRYAFVSKIGEGGNGVIYRARDRVLGRELVIKMIGRTALPSDVARRFFLREAQTAAQLNHPSIVTIYDVGQIEGHPYIAMELVEGESLADRLEGRVHPREAVPLVRQLADALDYAHERGVIHRDVKLENVMMTRRGDVKLMDFGLAKAIHGSPDKTDVVAGTPLYMSPEHILGYEVDHRTDIYALGVLIFRILTGTWPYDGERILELHRRAEIPKATERNADLPPELDRVIRHTMAKRPIDRYTRAGHVAEEIERLFEDRI